MDNNSSPVVVIEKIEYHTHNHIDTGEIISKLDHITHKLNHIMATQEQFAAALAKIDAATTAGGVAATAIQARITALIAAIEGAGLSAEVEAQLLAQTEGLAGNAEALATALTAMGVTPETPVPVPVPDPVPPVTP